MQKWSLLYAFILLFITSSVLAASVTQVKGQQVLISLDGAEVSEGDEFFLVNPDTQKKSGLIRIKKTKGSRATAEVLKGTAAAGFTLLAKGRNSVTSTESSSLRGDQGGTLRSLKNSYGLVGSYIMSTMNADINYSNGVTTVKTSTSMSGSGFGLGGFYDYVINPNLVARGFAAIEQFSATGSASGPACSNSTNCNANINYLSLYGIGKWYVTQSKLRTWLGGGLGYLLALSKSSSALKESEISTNSVITMALGIDYQYNRTNYVPISLEYNMFPASETVKANQIMIKAGWAWNL